MNTENSHSENERRVAARHRHVCMVGLRMGEARTQSHTLNLSQTGLRIVSDTPIEMGRELKLSLSLEPGVSVELTGATVWQRSIGSLGTYVVGIHFAAGQDERQGQLISWLAENANAA